MFIRVYTENADVLLNSDCIQRISFAKDDTLKASERRVKVLFTDSSKGKYIIHRKSMIAVLEANAPKVCTCDCASTDEVEA